MTRQSKWLETATNGSSAREIAAATQLPHTTVSRWIRSAAFPCSAVITIARAYNANVVDALVASGYITPEDRRAAADRAGVANATDQDLITELLFRDRSRHELTLRQQQEQQEQEAQAQEAQAERVQVHIDSDLRMQVKADATLQQQEQTQSEVKNNG
jgi:hypothetical protein